MSLNESPNTMNFEGEIGMVCCQITISTSSAASRFVCEESHNSTLSVYS